jgi:membrane protein involved in colicin uptake
LRKRLEDMADNDLARNGAPIEDEIPVRQTIAAAKRMEALAKEERVEEKKREREAEKAEKAGEKAAPKPILSWKERQEKDARKAAAEELQHKMVSMILLNLNSSGGGGGGGGGDAVSGGGGDGGDADGAAVSSSGGVKCKVLELNKEQMYDVESDPDLRTEMRSLRTQLQTMRTALWQSKSAINTALQERKREQVRQPQPQP